MIDWTALDTWHVGDKIDADTWIHRAATVKAQYNAPRLVMVWQGPSA